MTEDHEKRILHFAKEMFKAVEVVGQNARGDNSEVCIDRDVLHKLNSAAGHLDWAVRFYEDSRH